MFEERVVSGAHDVRRKSHHSLRGSLVVMEALKDVLINTAPRNGSGAPFCAVTLTAVDERIAMEQMDLWTDIRRKQLGGQYGGVHYWDEATSLSEHCG